MGLDMYLRRKYYPNMNHTKNIADILGIEDPTKVSYIAEEVMYWRKANHIHRWFVDNVQNGADDCGEYYVTMDNLENLLSVCNKVLENPELGEELLPTQEGFFFGSTAYDENYIDDIVSTIECLEKLLKEHVPCDYHYSSSW
jgi:hypothetical protein